jgi:5-methylcytosine-specific restriction endonuclease McrA
MIEKNALEQLVTEGCTIKEISEKVGLSFSGIRYWLKKYKLQTTGNFKPLKWNEEILRNATEKALTKADALRELGLLLRPGNYRTYDRYIKIYNIDTSHFNPKKHKNRFNNRKYTDEELFVDESTYTNIGMLKKRLLLNNYKKYECSICGNSGEWCGKILKLQLDHINGKNNDNQIKNLRFLCPNCHSQTETFCRA